MTNSKTNYLSPNQRLREESPGNAGKAWSPQKDGTLLSDFDRGVSVPELAKAHDRTTGSIRARSQKHGRLETQLACGASVDEHAWRRPAHRAGG
jgi:hypothetical protein